MHVQIYKKIKQTWVPQHYISACGLDDSALAPYIIELLLMVHLTMVRCKWNWCQWYTRRWSGVNGIGVNGTPDDGQV